MAGITDITDATPQPTQQHGPYHRLKSPTQTDTTALKQHQTSEIWGRPRRDSDIPQVQAYVGPLPSSAEGVEFTTSVRPDEGSPPGQVRWTGPRGGVVVEGGFAKIECTITRNTQVLLPPRQQGDCSPQREGYATGVEDDEVAEKVAEEDEVLVEMAA